MKLFPRSQRYEVATLNKRIRNTWDAFFRGQLALMVIIGVTVWLGLTILGVPGAFALGIIAGLLEIIPNIGPVLAAIPAVVVVLIQGSSHFDVNHLVFALIVIGFYVLIQAFENYVVVPQVLGEAVELHPLIVLAGVLIGASVWGILGALLAVPLIASLKEVMEYSRRKVLGEDPFPPERVRRIDRRESLWESVRALVIRGRRLTQEKIKLPGVQKDSDVDESQEGEK